MASRSPGFKLAALFAAIQLCGIVLLALYDWNAHVPAFLAVYLAACIVYGIAVSGVLTRRFDSVRNVSRWIVAGAVLLRLTVIWCPPTLSEDVYRYVWDGRVQNAGVSPYEYPPEHPALEALRDADYEKMNHKEFRTPYPPGAEILFRVLAAISTHHFFFKVVALCFDVLLILLLRKLLFVENRPPACLLIYAWHPLAALEFSANGHMDVISIALMFAGFVLLARSRRFLSGVALGAAILTKYLPAVCLPWVWLRGKWKLAAGLLVTTIVVFIPYYTPDLRVFRGLFLFYQKWWFNDSLFSLLRLCFGASEPARLAGVVAVSLVAAVALARRFPLYRSFFLINATIILFAPVVHPWYVLWLAPFLVFHRNDTWLFFTCWVAVSYVIRVISPGLVWQHSSLLRLAVYVPLYTRLAWDLWDAISGRRQTAQA